MTSAGVSGTLTAQQALERLLDGTSLSHRFIDPSTIAIDIRVAADAVQVTGEARLKFGEVFRSACRNAADHRDHSDRAARRAGRDDAHRGAAERARNHDAGGRRWRGSNTSGDMFNMRGFSANNSLFVDGVRDDGLLAGNAYNLEQIEVFSGPTGSDVGRANAAGYINLTTKTPQREALRRPRSATGRRTRARHVRRESAVVARRARNVLWQRIGSRECALAGWRRARTRLHGAPEQIDYAVARVRAFDTDAGNPVRARSCGRTTLPTTAFPQPRHRSDR